MSLILFFERKNKEKNKEKIKKKSSQTKKCRRAPSPTA